MLQPAQLNVCNLTYSEPSGCRSNTSVAMLQGGLPRSPARVRNEGTHLEKKTIASSFANRARHPHRISIASGCVMAACTGKNSAKAGTIAAGTREKCRDGTIKQQQ
jgi:hypothetical protein